MARVQLDNSAAPFAEVRARGFLFSFAGWDALHARLDQYWDEAPAPLLVSGPLGSGKSTAVRAWLHHRGLNPLSVAILEAGWLQADRAAEDILLAFGHRPVEAADAVGALTDFAEDRAGVGEPVCVLIANMHEGPDGLLADLLELDEQLDLAGQGIHLIMTADLDHWQGADLRRALHLMERFPLEALTAGETRRVVSAVLAAELVTDGSAITFNDEAIEVLYQQSGGLIGVIAGLFDDAVHHALDDGRSEVGPRDFGVARLDRVRAENAKVPLEEIAAHLVTKPVPRPAGKPARPLSYPEIATRALSLPTPANDRRPPIDGRLCQQLQSLHEQTCALEDHLKAIRQSVTALQQKSTSRRQALTEGASNLSEMFPTSRDDL
ncbi:MAG: hypothetical protein AAF225_05865 [Pseudomonadota bacterium]